MKALYVDARVFNILTRSYCAVRQHSFQKSVPLFQRELLTIQTNKLWINKLQSWSFTAMFNLTCEKSSGVYDHFFIYMHFESSSMSMLSVLPLGATRLK